MSMSIYSPCDGEIIFSGYLNKPTMTKLKLKGLQFSIKELIGEQIKQRSSSKYYGLVFRLNINAYRGFHAPTNFLIKRARRLGNDRLPLENEFISVLGSVLTKNERLALIGMWEQRWSALVAVGSLISGKIQTEHS